MVRSGNHDQMRLQEHDNKWFARYGLPNQLVSDNGPQFISSEFNEYMKGNGVKHMRTAAYHQSSNGQAERYTNCQKLINFQQQIPCRFEQTIR